MKFNQLYNNLVSGEWSQKMIARADTEQYPKACALLRNAFPQMQGGAFMRPGFRRTIADDNGGNLTTSKITSIISSSAKRALFPLNLSNGNRYIIFGNDNKPTFVSPSDNAWFAMNVDTNETIAITGSASTDSADAYIDEAQYAQVGDTLFIVSRGAAPRIIRFEGSTLVMRSYYEYWVNTSVGSQVWNGFPFGKVNSNGVNGTITVTGTLTVGGTVTLQASAGLEPFNTGMDAGDYFGLYMFVDGSNYGIVDVTSYTDTNTVTGVVLKLVPGTSPAVFGSATGTAWLASAWGPDSSAFGGGSTGEGWPTSITEHEQRLYFGRGSKFWGSRIGNVFDMLNFSTDADFDADNSTPWAGELSQGGNIQTMSSAKSLVMLGDAGEVVALGTQGPLGKLDFSFDNSTSFGADPVQPVRVNNFLTFVQKGGYKIRDIIFSNDEQQYKASDLSFVADHLTTGSPIRQICPFEFQNSSMLLARTAKGELLSLSLDREYSVNGWAKHHIGGALGSGEPKILALCPSEILAPHEDSYDIKTKTVFAIMKITINSSTEYALVQMGEFYDPDEGRALPANAPVHPHYLDYGINYVWTGAASTEIILYTSDYGFVPVATTAWTGLTRFANETVHAFADGIYIGEITISGTGTVTLETAASWLYLGYKYKMRVQPLPIETGSQVQNAQGLQKRTNEVLLRFYKSVGCNYGIPEDSKTPEKLHAIEFRSPSDPLDEPVPLFTGDKYVSMPGGARRKYSVYIESSLPYPLNILAMSYDGMTYD